MKLILSFVLILFGSFARAEGKRSAVRLLVHPLDTKTLMGVMKTHGWTLAGFAKSPHEEALVLDFTCDHCDQFTELPSDILHMAARNDDDKMSPWGH